MYNCEVFGLYFSCNIFIWSWQWGNVGLIKSIGKYFSLCCFPKEFIQNWYYVFLRCFLNSSLSHLYIKFLFRQYSSPNYEHRLPWFESWLLKLTKYVSLGSPNTHLQSGGLTMQRYLHSTFVVRIKWDDVHIQYTLLIIITMCLHGNSSPLQYSGLENSMDYAVHGVAKSRTQMSDFHTHTHTHIWTRLSCGLGHKRTSGGGCVPFSSSDMASLTWAFFSSLTL